MKKILILFLVLFSFLFVACSKDANNQREPEYESPGSINEKIEDDINILVDRKIYYKIQYSIETDNIETMVNNLFSHVSSLNGYIENSSKRYNNDDSKCVSASYIYRVPTEKINDLLDVIDKFSGVVQSDISSTDITTQYSATVERINTLTARKEAYNNILANDTLTMSDIIAINQKIDDIDTELNTYQNTKEKYDNLVDYSTVTVNFYLDGEYEEPSWADNYIEYLGSLANVIFNVIMYTLPFTLLAGIILIIIFFVSKKKKKHIE